MINIRKYDRMNIVKGFVYLLINAVIIISIILISYYAPNSFNSIKTLVYQDIYFIILVMNAYVFLRLTGVNSFIFESLRDRIYKRTLKQLKIRTISYDYVPFKGYIRKVTKV